MSSANPAELFEPPKLSVDKLPQLRALFERASSACIENFKEVMTAPLSCFLNQVEAGDSWDVVEGFEDCIAALFYVSEWDAQVLVAMEKRLLSCSIDVMFGGDGAEPPGESPRSLSKLEIDIAHELFDRTAACLAEALKPLASVTLSFERIETEIEFTIMGPQNVPCIYAQLLFQIVDHGGRMFILVPRAPLMPMRKKLERGTLRESQADDPVWSRQLQAKVAVSNVAVRAVVDVEPMTLGEISRLSIGQIISMDAVSESKIVLQSADAAMFSCSLGQLNGFFSVKIEHPVSSPKSLTDSILGDAVAAWQSST